MNKFLAMLLMSATLFTVACNNTEEAPAEETTTEEMPVEEAAPAADTTAPADTTAATPAQ